MKGAVLDYTAPAPHQVNLLAKLDHGGKTAQLTKNFCAQLYPNNASGLTYDPIWFWVVPYSCPLSKNGSGFLSLIFQEIFGVVPYK